MSERFNPTQTPSEQVHLQVTQSLINWEHLHQICDNNEEFELELLQTFVADTELHLVEINTAIATADFFELEQQAHHVKGASANTGVTTMYAIASELEHQARLHCLDGASQRLLVLQDTLKKVQAFLAEKTER